MNPFPLVSSPEVAILGAAALDWVARVKELPRRDGIVFADEYKPMPGGTGGNVAEGLTRLGHPARFLGKLGDDEGGRILKQAFDEAGVDLSGTSIIAGERSASCFIAIDALGERQIFCLGGVALYEKAAELSSSWFESIKVLMIADAYQETALYAIKNIGKNGKVVFNPGGLMANSGVEFLAPILKLTDILIVSPVEAEAMTGKKDPEVSNNELQKRGPQVVMQTLGAKGALVTVKDRSQHIPAYPVENVIDTTGAGDAFTSGAIAGILEGMDWQDCALVGCATASIKIAHLGARGGLPDRDQVKGIMNMKRGG